MASDALFRWIETQEAQLAAPQWGRVLDAGTGRHSLQWLTALDRGLVSEIVAVTGEKPLAEELQREFATDGLPLRVYAGNWMDDQFLSEEGRFDVVVADYLVGSIEGFAPYYQDEIFTRLKKLLVLGGRFYVVGLEPVTESPVSSCTCCPEGTNENDAQLVREMARIRDACILLAGRRCYREFPVTWTQRQLVKAGLTVHDNVKMTNVYTVTTILRQVKVARNQIKWFQDDALATAMQTALDTFEARVKTSVGKRKVRYGFDYVVAATYQESTQ
ncbi:hypothetical protein Poli38472_008384 [Pythium oligandrum]|uniref:Methyltransferase domain-containing protein n=1 Tax=Pythium oligandrum TaxID=41045 RepID=A0A8K1CNN6_PYTOL|nr:hypothetical protein Poli38472_008384 [Pythium oligandrum]|eukprot:TMW65742.1 hypothetical protein Poli38472_008384 [Pythium oligandrum]